MLQLIYFLLYLMMVDLFWGNLKINLSYHSVQVISVTQRKKTLFCMTYLYGEIELNTDLQLHKYWCLVLIN